jgi:hypothetical protein
MVLAVKYSHGALPPCLAIRAQSTNFVGFLNILSWPKKSENFQVVPWIDQFIESI